MVAANFFAAKMSCVVENYYVLFFFFTRVCCDRVKYEVFVKSVLRVRTFSAYFQRILFREIAEKTIDESWDIKGNIL